MRNGCSVGVATALVVILAGAGGHAARAQAPTPQIWDVKPGTPVGER